jgi:hypothetical protein
MNSTTKILTASFLILSVLIGAPLLLAPGRFLGLFAWSPVDPLLSRVLGAALLGMAWGAWQLLMKPDAKDGTTIIEMFAIFTLLSGFGWMRNLLGSYWWPGIWAVMVLFLIFGCAWLLVRIRFGKDG